jgi:SAM-dependent methyltransferase
MFNAKLFFDTYVRRLGNVTLLDLGSQDVNGSLRDVCPTDAQYIGVDFVEGGGVDITLKDPYCLPFSDNSIDIVVSSSCFEHSEMFWILFMEVLRILKKTGIFYLNVPSNGLVHRYPVDCWRFYPESGYALVAWANRCGVQAALLESYISPQYDDIWSDFVAVFVKDIGSVEDHPNRMISTLTSFENGHVHGFEGTLNSTIATEDQRQLRRVRKRAKKWKNFTAPFRFSWWRSKDLGKRL